MSRRRAGTPDPDERRKLFRRMEWVFVWAPPLLILLVGASSAMLVAWLVPFAGLGFWAKWLLVFALVTVLPLIVYLIRQRLTR